MRIINVIRNEQFLRNDKILEPLTQSLPLVGHVID